MAEIMTSISVIITTKNEAGHIVACLESIKAQTYKNIEIIVVDNHSSDKTKEIARRFTSNVFNGGPERSAQRNIGAKKAKGEFVLFLDADMILTPAVVEDCVSLIINHRSTVRALVIPEKSVGVGFWAKCKSLERACYVGVDWMEAARFYNKKAFEKLGGYDERLTGPEDFELAQRLRVKLGNGATGRVQSYIFHDEGHLSLAELLRKKYYYGKLMDRYRKSPDSRKYFDKQSNIVIRFGLFSRHPKMLLSDPVHAFGMLLMKTLEMGALAYGGLSR
jgi:glycosyltransferase involved in cell wall biosynthesis